MERLLSRNNNFMPTPPFSLENWGSKSTGGPNQLGVQINRNRLYDPSL